jgi:eukaryotic-like serine/threonine-protein kinase
MVVVKRMQLLGSRYRLAEPLGTGGMSVVWRGYDETLGRAVAVKVLARSSGSSASSKMESGDAESFSGRIRQEAMASARISHPNIAGVYDYGEVTESDGTRVPYMVMELVEGHSLATHLADGPLPWRQAVRVCAEVAAALVAAHEMGLVHRDISPANVLLAPGGAKVIDFGISARIGEAEATSMRLGTPAYIAPERFGGAGRVHPGADVYALGVLLYHSLTGAVPWSVESISQLLSHQRYVAPEPLPPVPGLPAGVAGAIARCLAQAPQERPTSVYMARKLAGVLGLRVAVTAPVDPPHAATAGAPGAARGQARILVVGQRPSWRAPFRTVTDAIPLARPVRHHMRRARRRRTRKVVLAGLASAALIGGGALADLASEQARTGSPAAAVQTPPATAPDPSPAGCSVSYHIRGVWRTGYTADVRVTNTGIANVSQWTLTFALPGNQHVVQGWNGVFGQQGQDVTVQDDGYNANLRPGTSTTLGFNGLFQQQNPTAREFRLNGVPCAQVQE